MAAFFAIPPIQPSVLSTERRVLNYRWASPESRVFGTLKIGTEETKLILDNLYISSRPDICHQRVPISGCTAEGGEIREIQSERGLCSSQ